MLRWVSLLLRRPDAGVHSIHVCCRRRYHQKSSSVAKNNLAMMCGGNTCGSSNGVGDGETNKDGGQEATSLPSAAAAAPPPPDMSSPVTRRRRSSSSSNMSDLLHMIAERRRPASETATGRRPSRSTRGGDAVLAKCFTSAAAAATQSARKQRPHARPAAVPEVIRVEKTTSEAVVSSTLLEKLRRNVVRKRLNWERMLAQHPLLQRLPVWRERSVWSARFAPSSALPLPSVATTTDVFVCSAPTGSGKSSLVPLFLLESHWVRLLQRIDASCAVAHQDGVCVENAATPPTPPMPFAVAGGPREFVAEFGASSRLCIVVSQPTRLACVELARFTAALVAASSSPTAAGTSSPSSDVAHVGGRVGYAVGGDACFSAATEIIYATPGYIVNALQHKGGAVSPTTLVVDEAHCRDMETDLLLAWAKQQLQEQGAGKTQLRQLLLMSATLPVEQMVAFFTSRLTGGVAATGLTPHTLLLNRAVQPYRVEEYFIDDLPDALEVSQVLRWGGKRNPLAAVSASTSSFSSSGALPAYPLLDAPARRVMASLGHFFSYTRFASDIHSPQARILAQFLLFILQSLATTPSMLGAAAQQKQPEGILVFLPGFAEMSLVLQSLEALCQAAEASTFSPQRASPPTHGGVSSNRGNVIFLRYEQWCFSVALLHATAIGSPQQQLHDSAGPFPHRIILATTVAESSVTIPNVRCVVDSCLERRFFTDPITGVMLRCTAVASASSLRQRGGRTGRTCDGVVIHLAPRRLFRQAVEANTALQDKMQTSHMPMPAVAAAASTLSSLRRGTPSGFVAPAQTLPESLTANAAAVLLRVKYLFPERPSVLVRNLPSPPSPDSIARGMEQLVELGLLQLAASGADGAVHEGSSNEDDADKQQSNTWNEAEDADDHMHAALCRYDGASLTAKGEFVAYLPIPHEQALLVYYALQFACVEESLLVACAMTVPSLLMVPRMTVRGGNSQAGTPALQYLQSLLAQRELAAVGRGGEESADTAAISGEERSGCHLSEPLMLRSLLREWYACHDSSDVVAFHAKYRLNRSAIRLVDGCVAQCAARLYHLFAVDANPPDDAAELHGEYDTAVRRPSTQAVEQLITSAFPRSYRALLAGSLQRLHCCALDHAAHRLSPRSCTMTHWYPHDKQLIRLLQPSAQGGGRKQGRDGKRQNGPTMIFGAFQHRLSAAFVAAFARNTMRGEDGSHRVHYRRLVRNLGALQEEEENICSFTVELHAQQPQAGGLTQATLHERLTPEELHRVLVPYLADTHLRQLDLFASGRSAVACFGAEEVKEPALAEDALAPSVQQEARSQQQQQLLLAPQVLPFERAVKSTTPAVMLAHIGISLLVAIQSVLTRLTVLLPPVTVPGKHDKGSSTGGSSSSSSSNHNSDGGGGEGGTRDCSTPTRTVSGAVSSTYRGIRFASEQAAGEAPSNVRVTWYDNYGHMCSLLLSDVRRAGYEELFPTPSEAAPEDAANVHGGNSPSATMGRVLTSSSCTETEARYDDAADAEENVMLSVQRVAYTRAVYWKVTLPAVRVAAKRCCSGQARTSCTTNTAATPAPVPGGEFHYCWVCHSALMQHGAFLAHCRSVTHLSRLAFAVRHGMRRDWVEAFSNGTPSHLLLRQNESEGGGMGMELRRCSVSPTSFMNALQLQPRSDTAVATMPIAIAGSLVAQTTAAQDAPSASMLGPGANLQALHVWVLDAETKAAVPANASMGPHTVNSLPSSVFVLAGYLAAASTGFEAALLMNEDHSRVYAVMLHDWGVWRLPAPLTRTQLRCVLEVFAGKPWRGVPVVSDDVEGDADCNGVGVAAAAGVRVGGTHWCIASDLCPQCTYCGSGCNAAEKRQQRQNVSCDDTPSPAEVVEGALLIVLHEYKNSQRSVISFADYVQRVVAKLNAWSAAQQRQHEQQGSTATRLGRQLASNQTAEGGGGAELLARFVTRRHNQPLESLLRDIGCQFLTPPDFFLQTAGKQPISSTVRSNDTHVNRTVSFSASAAVAAEGTTTEKLFLLPTVLPSYLPSPEFAALLRRHRRRIRQASGDGLSATNAEGLGVATNPQPTKQQPLF
ncbi:putative helicase [Trypanosoma rangeli]|uniref:Putative helicase n=1 Tax=Trypanosoma rangeli TaxID=5698 RepID=A0A3R7K6G2_TRYRA|nr:putative helicase [Trypanosoma rangeli]RNF00746.1 putative helicase [Trypanosoma rangeli]|eukprot:RNF00746.1 putative helicase [Trypanosoma rangeli]